MFVAIIEYPDSLTVELSSFIAKIPASQLVWQVGAFLWLGAVFYIGLNRVAEQRKGWILTAWIAVGLIALRLPNLILPMLSFDESDWAVCAATLMKRPVFWRDVDATTSGPLNIYPLTIISILGLSINYFTLRLFGLLLCVVPAYFLVDRLIRRRYAFSFPLLLTLPLLIGLGLLNDADLVAFNSTHIPMVVFAVCFFLLLYPGPAEAYQKKFYLLMFILGCFPYMKLQTVPTGFVFALWGYYTAFYVWRLNVWVLVTGLFVAILPSLIVATLVYYFAVQNDFWESYIVNNLLYTKFGVAGKEKTWWYKLRVPLYLINGSPSIRVFFYGLFSVGLASFLINLISFRKLQSKWKSDIVWTSLVLVSAYYSISVTGNIIHYYILLLVVPLTLWTFSNVAILSQVPLRVGRKTILIAYVGIAIVLPAAAAVLNGSLGVEYVRKGYRGQVDPNITDVIRRYAKPDDSIVVLGYRPDLYIQSETLLGIRAAATYRFSIPFDQRQQAYYEKIYVADIKRNRPKVFVDAIGHSDPSYAFDVKKHKYENYPLLKEIVDANYWYVGTYDGVRVFALK